MYHDVVKHPGIFIGAACLSLVAACSGHHRAAPAPHPASTTAAASASHAAADCAKLSASPFPPAAYDQLLITEAGRITGGTSASPAQVRKAKATVAAEIRSSCPQFENLLPGH